MNKELKGLRVKVQQLQGAGLPMDASVTYYS